MKKNYTLLMGLILIASVGFAQNFTGFNDIPMKLEPAENQSPLKKAGPQKAFGDTIFYEDFGGGSPTALPLGWTTVDNNSLGFEWIWSNAAPGGQFSTTISALASTSGSNGFLQLPCDLYNTPIPGSGAVTMDTYVQSPSFSISPVVPSVGVQFEHYQRYCCNPANELVMEVSTDGINWSVPYDGTDGRGPNTLTPNGEILSFNVSADLGNQMTGYVRFRSFGNSHYFWMIDDLLVFEGPENAMEIEDWEVTFHNTYFYAPVYKQLPIVNISPAIYSGATWNTGSNDATGARLELEVFRDSAIGGGPGSGLAHTAFSQIGTGTVLSGERDTTSITNAFFSFNTGWYRNRVFISTDSVNQTPGAAEGSYTFALTADTTIALDRGPGNYSGDLGPGTFTIGGQDNDAIANLMILDSAMVANNGTVLAKSISLYISGRAANDQCQISPRIWNFDEDSITGTLGSGFVGGLAASSPFSVTLDTNDFLTWVTLPLFPPVALGAGQYYYGAEQTGGGASNNAELFVGRDQGQEAYMGVLSTVLYFNDATAPQWGNSGRLGAIRFNGTFPAVSVDEVEKAADVFGFEVYPNPNEGLFTLKASSTQPVVYNLNVRNMVGQTVMSEAINVNGVAKRQMDLSSFEKGVYFVTLENGSERLVKKVVVK